MPELPEVETIKEDLRALVTGSRIERAEVPDERLVEGETAAEFAQGLSGRTIEEAHRRGKHLVLELDDGRRAVMQLKIGGQLLLVPPVEEPASAVMLVLYLEDERRLFLRDETGYTRAQLYTGEALRERLSTLGPEPLGDEFSVEYLRRVAGDRRAQIKPLILDQSIAAGVGNIYADEALHDARLHPRRKASSLSEEEWENLHRAIRENLAAGIEYRGTTFSLYRDVLGREGAHQHHLKVFLREEEPCPACGGKVVREQVGGRATFVCPACQPERPAKAGDGDGLQLELGL
ncbi:bifunctional DNA-formamidopyrimidine glycosylase/DNA-(apurinic or apyrimidinic site) lyase [Rubrobacter aplysinae]|uniref:bifunctional DNA-formamidopyrimidine glycosylase/DNA-(apurinic or apyrimidinic site) lyase n=1 Tax=Rubrobacter aplysinae TaxID=909625 RepID=UPI00064B9C06|nr:bifunctional DNA-formamidopyrimidine glycosylase/DNA-(apurinic or apyrimidinic site) lyase [Rubrobacter aplysinae]